MIIPALPQVAEDLKIRSEAQTQLMLSAYVVSYVFGPFLFAPLSELYGRLPILQLASLWFLLWNLLCGFAHSEGMLVTARLMAGMGASAALAVCSYMVW